jgi:hypothetical protein
MDIKIGKIYKVKTPDDTPNFFKVTKIGKFEDGYGRKYEIEGHFLQNPDRIIAVGDKSSLIKLIPEELFEIAGIKEKHLPKINQDDINDFLIDINIDLKNE